MDKEKLLSFIATLLGFCAAGLPAAVDIESDMGTNSLWWFGLYLSWETDGFQEAFNLFEEPIIGVPSFIAFVLVISGAILSLIVLLDKMKVKLPPILPGILILAGCVAWFVTPGEHGPFFTSMEIPVGILPALAGGAIMLVLGIMKMIKSAPAAKGV
jgi:hypothetical protein